jgi:NAD(P)-dependent dehydrogenase (short-subunit alcohol dehydrogenase family)
VSTTTADILAGLDLSDRTFAITGASSGLGRESARALAGAGAHVVLVARRSDALTKAESRIREEFPDAQLSLVALDLTSLASVHSGAAQIAERAPQLHGLINNAGVMFTPFGRTSDGFEMQFGTNHLGHFELTRLLLPQLRAADGARVVNLSSDGHRIADLDLDDPNWERRDYDKFAAYGASKTANVLHAVELGRRLADDGICCYAVHPGMVATALARHMDADDVTTMTSMGRDKDTELPELLRPEVGASTQLWAAVSPTPPGGVYLADCAVSAAEPYAVDPHRAAELWTLSERLVG